MRRKFLLLAGLIVLIAHAKAQLVAAQKVQFVNNVNIVNVVDFAGNAIEIPLAAAAQFDVVINSVKDSVVAGIATQKNMKGTLQMMGQEIAFDSKNSDAANINPMIAAYLQDVNKPDSFVLVNGKLSVAAKQQLLRKRILAADVQDKLTLPIATSLIQVGYRWVEKIQDAAGSFFDIAYEITKLNKGLAEIASIAQVKFATSNDQMQNLEGVIKNSYVYDVKVGVLKTAKQTNDLTFWTDARGQHLQVKMKGTIDTVVQ